MIAIAILGYLKSHIIYRNERMPHSELTEEMCAYHQKNPHINILDYGQYINPRGAVSRDIRESCKRQYPSQRKTLVQRMSASIRRKKKRFESLDLKWFIATYRNLIYPENMTRPPPSYSYNGTTFSIEEVALLMFLHGFNIHADETLGYVKYNNTYDDDYMRDFYRDLEDTNAITSDHTWLENLITAGVQFYTEPESHIVRSYKKSPITYQECVLYRRNTEKDPRKHTTYVNENDRNYVRDTCMSKYGISGITYEQRTYSTEQVANILREYGRQHITRPPIDSRPPLIKYISRIYEYSWVERTIAAGVDEALRAVTSQPIADGNNEARRAVARSHSKTSSTTKSHTPYSVTSAPETLPLSEHKCTLLFRDVLESSTTPAFKSLVRKMTKRCTDVIDKCETRNIRSHIAGVLDDHDTYASRIYIRSPAHALQETFAGKLLRFKNLSYIPRISYNGQNGIGSGVFHDYLTNCLTEAKKLFAPIHDASERYVIHPNMSPSYASELGYGDNLTDDDVCKLYELVGELFAYCARKDIPIPFYFSRMILAKIVYSSIPTDMSVLYYLLEENATVRSSILSILQDPRVIDYVPMMTNDVLPLNPSENVDITKDNYIAYLDMYSRHLYWKQLKIEQTVDDRQVIVRGNDTSRYLDAFIRGFYIRKQLRKLKTHVRELDNMLSDMRITYESVMEWINTTKNIKLIPSDTVYTRPMLTPSPGNVEKQMQIFEWFKEILKDGGDTIPLAYTKKIAPNMQIRDRKHVFVEFIKKLMEFWSSLQHINVNQSYTISIKYADNMFPTSATCFRIIYLSETIESKKKLYETLIHAVFNVNMGIDLA